jgi:hypothetical protein
MFLYFLDVALPFRSPLMTIGSGRLIIRMTEPRPRRIITIEETAIRNSCGDDGLQEISDQLNQIRVQQ